MSQLFSPLQLGGLTLSNRIAVSPMCQYSAHNGLFSTWHLQHLSSLAMSGAALVMIEATNVSANGRITEGCTGLWSDEHGRSLADVLAGAHKASPGAVFGIQIGHAGRKGPTQIPWQGGKPLTADQAWSALAPSPIPLAEGWPTPKAMSEADIAQFKQDCVSATRRALAAGVQVIELHAAHGYLLHQFLSPIANHRTDEYGGSLENRMRFPLEVFDAVREAYPAERPVWMRVSATDWVPNGWDIDGTIALSHALKARGCAAVHVSTGGVSPQQAIKIGPGYQVPYAQRVKAEVGLPTLAVGLITEPEQAEAIIANDEADMISIARAMLYDPRWPWHAAARLGAQVDAPKQYWRSQPRGLEKLFRDAHFGQR